MTIVMLILGLTWLPAGWYGGRCIYKSEMRYSGPIDKFTLGFALLMMALGWIGFFLVSFIEPRTFFGESVWNWWVTREPTDWDSIVKRFWMIRD